MAKVKVFELSKELEVSNKEIISYLQENGVEVKAAQSSLEDNAVEMVRSKFAKKAGAPASEPAAKDEPKVEAKVETKAETKVEPKAEAKTDAAAADSASDQPVKKKKIIFVSNNQNSNNGGKRPNNGNQQNNRPQNGGNRPQGGQNNGQRNNSNGGYNKQTISGNSYARPQLIKPRESAINRPIPDRVAAHEEVVNEVIEEIKTEEVVKTPVNTENTQVETVTTPADNSTKQEAPKREFLKDIVGSDNRDNRDNRNRNNDRNNGDRPNFNRDRSGDRNNGDRPNFNRDRNNDRSNGDRPNFNRDRSGDRNNGDRPNFNRDRSGDRNNGDRPNFNRDRSGDRNNGDRPNFNRDRNGTASARPSFGGPARGNDKPSFATTGMAKPGSDRRDDKFKNKNHDNKENEKKQNDKRRNQERESRNKRDYMMVDDEETLEMKRRKGKFIKPEKAPVVEEEVIKVISVEDTITIKDLADKMKIQGAQIVKKLFLQGQIVTLNSEISYEEAENIAIEYDIICEKAVKVDVIEELLKEVDDDEDTLVERPPVVCVMGHVDHGKTSLLDAIRKTKVTDKEAGGITQAIGAYIVDVNDRKITFLDTPGHEAFTAMRMRGATATDIAVLVVAADDGVMPQTVEAINHAKAAGVEIIVAVNKIDKPGANPDKVKQELTEYELIPTDWGGSTEFVNISAKRGDGIEDLLETILLTADIMELKANPKRKARGLVIEAQLDKGRGPVATVLVQKGTLKVGDFISAGIAHGKVRAMIDDKGRNVKVATPSVPVEILGLSDVPAAGDAFIAHDNDKTAKSFADTFIAQNKEKKLDEIKAKMSLDDLFNKIQEGNLKELKLIIKADVQGSVEAVKQSLSRLSNEEVVVKCIHGGVGAINESDVVLASASEAIIIGFNVRPDTLAKAAAEREGVDLRLYDVIYKAIEDVEAAMKGMLDPVYEEKIIGHAEVRQIFKASAIGNIAGSYVLDGMFQRNCKVRISREGEQIFEGELASLKRFKDDVKEVKAGFECGLVFEGFDSMKEFDIVEAYIMVEVPR